MAECCKVCECEAIDTQKWFFNYDWIILFVCCREGC